MKFNKNNFKNLKQAIDKAKIKCYYEYTSKEGYFFVRKFSQKNFLKNIEGG